MPTGIPLPLSSTTTELSLLIVTLTIGCKPVCRFINGIINDFPKHMVQTPARCCRIHAGRTRTCLRPSLPLYHNGIIVLILHFFLRNQQSADCYFIYHPNLQHSEFAVDPFQLTAQFRKFRFKRERFFGLRTQLRLVLLHTLYAAECSFKPCFKAV